MIMENKHLWIRIGILIFIVICNFVPNINGAGSFELKILEILNEKNHLIDGYCCGSNEKEKSKTVDCPRCTTAFRLCLKEFPGGAESFGCPFGKNITSVLGGSSFELHGHKFATISVPFTFRWTQSFSLILQALDMYRNSSSPAIIEEVAYSGAISPPSDWINLNNSNQPSRNALIKYKIRVICDEHYYNSTCTVLCKPRDDYFGHYTCGNKGQKVCQNGWSGENCDKPICPDGCNNNGTCDRPGVCKCLTGYKGSRCDECQTYPGCKNGFCMSPWECRCYKNWGGILCDKDLNYCGTHEPCLFGGTCHHKGGEEFSCTCPEGLSGARCEIVEHPCAPVPCKNGATCTIKEPPSQKNVTKADKPRQYRGMSSMGTPVSARTVAANDSFTLSLSTKTETDYVCTCPLGFSGERCEQNIDECENLPCRHGATCVDLVNDYQCNCVPGFTGKDCEINVDECANNPCQNGECMDMINAFYCLCPDGFSGTLCETMINDPTDLCSSAPCHNNGTCESGDGWFRCVCSMGFDGPDCRININECASQPCTEGSTCIDGIGAYSCICPLNKRGRRCEILLSNSPPKCSFSIVNDVVERNLCNSCLCGEKNETKCSNLWCGLPNCVAQGASVHECNDNEVCVPALRETCLSPPCDKRGDCRKLEQSLRTSPPKYPATSKCWPNQAMLNENCSRINVVLDMLKITKGLSTESFCHNLRTILGGQMLQQKFFSQSAIIIICDIKSGSNDTIEVTISCNDDSSSILPKIVATLGELLSRPKLFIKDSYFIDYPEIITLNAIVEIKVETAITNENSIEKEAYLLVASIGVLILITSSVIYIICLWQSKLQTCSRQSEIDLSVTDTTRCHDEEKSNNLQNEENFRRYANPLKNSTCSLRSSNVELNPIQDIAGPSGLVNRSQLTILKNPNDFSNDFETSSKTLNSQSLYKTQNSDVDKNTVQGIESQSSKDFDKCINKVDFKYFSASVPSTHFNSSNSLNAHQAINNVNSNDTLTLHI